MESNRRMRLHVNLRLYPCSSLCSCKQQMSHHDDVIKWKHFPRYWPFVRGIHRWPANSPHKGQWRGALMFSLICAGINGWVNNRGAGDLRRHRAHYDVIAMPLVVCFSNISIRATVRINFELNICVNCRWNRNWYTFRHSPTDSMFFPVLWLDAAEHYC